MVVPTFSEVRYKQNCFFVCVCDPLVVGHEGNALLKWPDIMDLFALPSLTLDTTSVDMCVSLCKLCFVVVCLSLFFLIFAQFRGSTGVVMFRMIV
jgi:hypothetical protein